MNKTASAALTDAHVKQIERAEPTLQDFVLGARMQRVQEDTEQQAWTKRDGLKVHRFEEFHAGTDASNILNGWLKRTLTAAAGSPTLEFADDVANGCFRLKNDAQDESQILRVDQGDNLSWQGKGLIFECGLIWNPAGAAGDADTSFVAGIAGAHNATLDSVAKNVWFKVTADNLNLLCESDDGTTDTDDKDTGVDVTKGTLIQLRIELDSSGQNATFSVNTGGGFIAQAHHALGAGTATDAYQPYVRMSKDSTAVEELLVDYVSMHSDR